MANKSGIPGWRSLKVPSSGGSKGLPSTCFTYLPRESPRVFQYINPILSSLSLSIKGAIPHRPLFPPPNSSVMSGQTLYVASLCVAASLAFIWKWRRGGSRLPFPPGPKGLPLLGNVFDIPRGVPLWLTFTSMAKKYGAFVSRALSLTPC